MFDKIRNRMESDEGFTLIELLVVILIIGILAAIAIPSFLNQRYKGQDACAKSMVKQMQTAAKTYQTDNNSYNNMTLGPLTTIESTITGSTANGSCQPLAVGTAATATGCNGTTPTTATDYCVAAQSVSGNYFQIVESAAGVTRSCYVPTGGNNGGCKGTSAGSSTAGSW